MCEKDKSDEEVSSEEYIKEFIFTMKMTLIRQKKI